MIKAYKRLIAASMAAAISFNLGCIGVIAADDTDAAVNEAELEVQAETVTGDQTSSEESISPKIRKMMTVLKEFEIIPDYYDYNLPLTYEVPRADFAASVARMMGKTKYGGSDIYFYDVPKNYWAFNEISNLVEMGIIKGAGDKTFSPGETITKAAAYKILLCAMGYGQNAELEGGYPSGYTSVANRIKLSDGVTGGEKVTMSDMLNILYNSLTINIMEPDGGRNSSVTYKVSDDETLISFYRDILYGEGYVNGADTITVNGKALAKGSALIGDNRYSCEGFKMIDYLGEKVEFFYEDKDKNRNSSDEKKLLWLGRKNSSQEIKYISVDDDAYLDTDTFTYTYYDDKDKQHRIRLDRSVLMVYNGGVVTSGYDEILNNGRYELKLISDDGKYTVMVVRGYENYAVGVINSLDRIIYDKNRTDDFLNLDEDDYDTFSIKLMGNDDMSFEDIKKDSVLTVYKSKDNKHIEVYVCNNLVNGVIESINNSDNIKVSINGTEYRVDEKLSMSNYSIGDDVTAYTNVYGEIVYMTVKVGGVQGSFLLKATLDELEETMYIKQLGEDSKVSRLTCVEKMTIDGVKYKNAKDAYKAILDGESKLTAQFVMLKKNENNEITEIDTANYNPAKETPNSLQVDVPFMYGEETTYKQRLLRVGSNATRIGERIVFDAKTKVFIVPFVTDFDNVSEDDLWVATGSMLANDTGAYAQSYKTEENIGIAKYILLMGYDPNRVKGELPILVEKVTSGTDENGNTVEILEGYQGSGFVSIAADEAVDDLYSKNEVKPGDVVTLTKDSHGKVKGCTVVYDYRNGEHRAISAWNDISGMFVGYAHDVVENVVKIGFTSGAEYEFAINAMSKPVVIYDTSKTKNPISAGTIGDIVTYKNNPANCSTVFIATNRMQPQAFIVYK